MLTRSTLPVRSPLPNRQPSMRSAPAISANSPAAVPVPRSLCGCTDSTIASRRSRWRCIHSTMSAKMFGVLCSTVDGRLTMHLCCGVGCQTAVTASTTRLLKASSVPENISGEYWKVQCGLRLTRGAVAHQPRVLRGELDDAVFVQAQHHARASPARWRCTGARWRAARRRSASKLRWISGSRACVSTWIVTSSGIRSSSMSRRTKSKSACDADGKPTSICLKPMRHQHLEHAQLARRVHRLDQGLVAVAQVDAAPQRRRASARASGQRRSGKPTGRRRGTCAAGSMSMGMARVSCGLRRRSPVDPGKANGPLRCAGGPFDPEEVDEVTISAPAARLVAAARSRIDHGAAM